MNILFVTAQPSTPQMMGGLQSSVDELALHLVQGGHQVSLLCALMGSGVLGIRGRLMMKLLRHKAARDTVVGYPVWRAWFPWESLAWVADRIKPDLVVVLARQPVRMALAAKRAGIPVLMMLQDVEFKDHGGSFSDLGPVACVANSQFTADRYREAFGVAPVVIPPLIDGRKKYATETSRKNVTFINPHPFKGVELAIAVARQCPEIPFSFVEAWPLRPEERQNLQAKLALAPNITLHPPTKDMRQIYNTCKILLAPSLWEEAYGRVASEAQFSGIPVIASHHGGLPEAVGPGGILLDPKGPVEAWVAAVRRLWNESDYYAALSAAASAYADRPSLRWDIQAGLWEDIFAAAARQTTQK
jgi:glycosyltransferase involved in cell wall biosynthesis